MRKLILFIIILPLLSSCEPRTTNQNGYDIASKISGEALRETKRDGFQPAASGGSYFNTIREVAHGYTTDKYPYASIEDARDCIIRITDRYLKCFNENRAIRPYLHNFPFDTSNISLLIMFKDKNGAPLHPPYISLVNCAKGKIWYEQWNIKNKMHEEIFIETYEEANILYQKSK